ncbi:hypothetical protein [Corynebacterium sp. 335C]
MSEEKLTVAELLARAGKEAAPSDGGRRRRRRSLEEGGISVADLTGGQPRVQAEGPRRGAHAAADADDAAEEPQVAAPAEPEARDDEPAAAPEPQAPAADAADARDDAPAAAPEPERAAATPLQPEPEPEPAPAPAPERARRTPVTVADRSMRAGVPLATPVSPAPVMEVPEAGEITFTFTALHDAETASQPVAEQGPMALEALGVFAEPQPEPEPEPEPQPEPEEPRASAAAPAAGAAAAAAGAPAVASFARPDEPAPGEARTDVQGAIRDEDLEDREEAGRAGEFDDVDPSARTGVLPVVADDEPEADEADADDADDAAEPAAAPEKRRQSRPAQSEDDSLSYGLLVVQVLVGLLAGAALFLVFMVLWHSALPAVVTALIALAVTGLLVAAANGLRRRRDTLTPILAGVVGLLLTFGPWLMSLF